MPDTMSKRTTIGLIFGIIAMLLIVTTLILPWWGMHTIREDVDLHDGDKYYSESGGIGFYSYGTSLYSGEFSVPALFGATTMLMIIALIFTALFITMVFLYEMEKIRTLKLAKILGVLALIFCLIAPIIFAAAFPGAMKADEEKRAEDSDEEYESPDHDDPTKSFFGDYKDTDEDEYYKDTTTQSWGGDIGWNRFTRTYKTIPGPNPGTSASTRSCADVSTTTAISPKSVSTSTTILRIWT